MFSAFETFSEQIQNNLSLIYQAKIVVISSHFFIILIWIIAHDLKPSRKRKKSFVIQRRDKILHDIFW